jgi:hypothetical protein
MPNRFGDDAVTTNAGVNRFGDAPIPETAADQPGFLAHLGSTLASAPAGIVHQITHPIDALKNWRDSSQALHDSAVDSFESGDYQAAAAHGVNFLANLIPGLGKVMDDAASAKTPQEFKAKLGDVVGSALLMKVGEAAPGAVKWAGGKIGGAVDVATNPDVVRAGVKVLPKGPAAVSFYDAIQKARGRAPADAAPEAAPTPAAPAVDPNAPPEGVPQAWWDRLSPPMKQQLRDKLAGAPAAEPDPFIRDEHGNPLMRKGTEDPAEAAARPPGGPTPLPASRQLAAPGRPPIVTAAPADASGVIPGWKPAILEREGPPATSAAPAAATPAAAAPAPAAAPPPPAPGEPGSVAELPLKDIHLDPVRFQFKQNVGARGVSDKLKDVSTWDPDMAGMTHVWRDPEDGQIYAVNGHHRVDLANRLDVPTMTSRFLKANTAQEARTAGALINIGEGNGTALDAAKLFRESGMTAADLESRGVAIKGEVASQGLALAKLDPHLFAKVASGEMPMERGAIIGGGLDNPADQRQLFDVLEKSEQAGKRMTNDQVGEMIRLANGDQTAKFTETQHSLFGDEEVTRSLIKEKAEVSDYIRKRLGQERQLFATVGTERAASHLGATGNVIVAGDNAKVALQTSQAQLLYDKLSTSAGDVSDQLNSAATALAKGQENPNAVKARTFNAIKTRLIAQAKALTGGGGPGSEQPGGLGEAGASAAGQGQPAEIAPAAANPAKAAFEAAKANGNAPAPGPANPAKAAFDHAAAPRKAKVNALADTLHGHEISAEDAARMNPRDWNQLSDALGINRPSPTTVTATIEELKSREAGADLNRDLDNTLAMARRKPRPAPRTEDPAKVAAALAKLKP